MAPQSGRAGGGGTDMKSGVCFKLFQERKGDGGSMKRDWQNVDNIWSWVMKTWRFIMLFSVPFHFFIF